MTGGNQFGLLQYGATSGRNDAPYVLPFPERSTPDAVLPLKDGGPLRA